MDLTRLIKHPELMDKETLYDLRSLIALYPYYQTARLLMLQNLYLLHDPTFDEELRRAAIYITDRKVIFQLVEAAHYQFKPQQPSPDTQYSTLNPTTEEMSEGQKGLTSNKQQATNESRTISLIDTFLDSIPANDEEEHTPKRKPTPADAAVDYVSYLLEIENEQDNIPTEETPQMKGQSLIDNFINNEGGNFELKETPEYLPELDDAPLDGQEESDEGYFTETLARIYIKQGRYEKALEIIQRLYLNYPKKNAYFADQIRFLRKLIINNNQNK